MYLDSCLVLCVLGVLFVVQNVVATGQWTYATTSSTCAGTYADPCGPVSSSLSRSNPHLIAAC